MSTSPLTAPRLQLHSAKALSPVSLPGGRIVLGSLLVTASAFLALGAATGFFSGSTTSVVVATRDLPPGTRIGPTDVTTANLSLDSSMARHTIGKTAVVVGNTLTGPLKAGEIVQPGAVAPTASGVTNGVQVSMSLPIARAVGGSLAAGETVDVVATEKGAFKARTVASGAVIISAQSASNASLGTGGDTVVTLSVPTRDEAIAIAGAIDTGTVTLVRTTGSQPTIDTPIINEAITNRASGS